MHLFKLRQKGFTLIELLVVISIISLLSSVVLASLNGARAKARDTKRISDLKQIQVALEMYRNDNSGYPSTPGGWRGNCSGHGSFPASGASGYIPGLAPQYISILPLDPKPVGTVGCYLYNSNGTDYMLLAHWTVEGTVPSSFVRPAWNGYQTFAIYTPGASGW